MRAVAVAFVLLAGSALAAPRAFPFTWDSSTLAKGDAEVTAWLTPRLLRQNLEPFARFETRAGLMLGLTSFLETLIAIDVDLDAVGVDGKAADPRLSSTWHLSPLKAIDWLGVSALTRVAVGFDAFDLEARLILDKRFGDVWVALNGAAQKSLFWSGRSGIDLRFEESAALGYVLPAGVTVSVEARLRTAFQATAYQGTALYVGPGFMYSKGRFWVGFSIMAQVAGDRPFADSGLADPLALRDNERFQGRLMVGFHGL